MRTKLSYPFTHGNILAFEDLERTRRERLKSALYLRLKKRKTFFCEKLEIFEKKISFAKCRTVPKNVKEGTLFDFQTCILLQNKKLKGGTLWGHLKIFEKKSHSAEKNQKGDPLASAGFEGYVKKVKNERGDPLETKKLSKKSRTVPKKIRKGESLVPSGFVGYLEKVKNERGDPLH